MEQIQPKTYVKIVMVYKGQVACKRKSPLIINSETINISYRIFVNQRMIKHVLLTRKLLESNIKQQCKESLIQGKVYNQRR